MVDRSARLRALRLVGFKSFAERTIVEFGPGISAIVGPNGSGKSNLADALRWALGEQGRSLRTRKSEDVIFAGSASRQATGMADVTLVIGNEDRLLPIDYAEIDLGRRLYRSGENEYLLNRQRVRLRDVVELLDAANLADNAFLFIGQGMVDQALSMRAEERRPLFEEVAGVRRHERRRRAAEAQLAEAESNLARVRDILAELRPQARRLSVQAEQQTARRDAALELAEALVAAARERWLTADAATQQADRGLVAARSGADAALADLRSSEDAAAVLTRSLTEQADAERAARAALGRAEARLTELRVAEGRRRSESAAAERDRERLAAERADLDGRLQRQRVVLATVRPETDASIAEDLEAAERALLAAEQEWTALRDAGRQKSEREAALQRAMDTRAEEAARARRAAEAATEHATRQREAAERATVEAEETAGRLAQAAARLREAVEAEAAADAASDEARSAAEAAGGLRAARVDHERTASAGLAAARARIERLERELDHEEARTLIATARRRGGRPIAEGLEVDPAFRSAVEAGLGEAIRGVTLSEAAVRALGEARGTVLLADGATTATPEPPAQLLQDVLGVGGGRLAEGLRRDPDGLVGRLLARDLWVPSIEEALALRASLPVGWRLVGLDGAVVDAAGVVHIGAGEPLLARRAERDRLVVELANLERAATEAAEAAAEARAGEEAATASLARARRASEAARGERRAAEEAERAAARRDEQASREAVWARSQAEREGLAAKEAAERLERLASAPSDLVGTSPSESGQEGAPEGSALRGLEARVAELREARDRVAARARSAEEARRREEDARRRAEIAIGIDEERLVSVERQLAGVADREARNAEGLTRIAGEIAAASEARSRAERELEALLSADAEQRTSLATLEAQAARAREQLRAAEERSRISERQQLEARLQQEAAREQLLVELVSLGPIGVAVLEEHPDEPGGVTEEALAGRLEQALDAATARWRATVGPSTPQPVAATPSLATLRRRYHELGASNPFAAEEYAEVKARLDDLETQRSDLETAIEQTRQLIVELTTLMAERFRSTFAALEKSFGAQFEALFGGGEATLELTDPQDLSNTGIEITARPPGKKRQALAMLSGGERALTAVALLFAMLEVRPVPFCVLDEVDAALDEANISRFADALRGLAERTQFVVITHNRGTIERADALYGVTIGDDAVSRVISIRLSDPLATPELAEAAPEEAAADPVGTPA
jgi:chromosome segregation protein